MYALIVEWKDEGPLVMEGNLMTYDQAIDRKRLFLADSRVIRIAIAKLVYEEGNLALLKEGAEQ